MKFLKELWAFVFVSSIELCFETLKEQEYTTKDIWNIAMV